jgi:predicted nucleotidyltransferase
MHRSVADTMRKHQEENKRLHSPFEIGIFARSYASALVATTCYIYLMTTKALVDPILKRFRAALDEIYGNRLDRVVLFGSHARGEARPDSDYDIAVFLKDPDSFWKESGRLAEIETDILYDTGAVINALPFPAGAYREQTPLMHEVRREGRDL